jgi:hypothetical protein
MPLQDYKFARHTDFHDWAWANPFSICHSDGPIVRTAKQIIQGLEKPITLVVPMSDGYSTDPDNKIARKGPEEFQEVVTEPNTIVGILCTRNFTDPRAFFMPLDDETFDRGVVDVVSSRTTLPAWEDRKPIAYWRGCLSGGKAPTLRTRVVWDLYDFPSADAKLTRTHNMNPDYQGRFIFPEDTRFYDINRGLEDHVKYKYILIVDGNCIASAHQWVFASGSVPIMVTHPDNEYWFKKYLKPGFHYMPVKHDLSDLKETIEWLVSNDTAAKKIAQNAMEFARTVLSSEFQHGYLLKEIKRVAESV